jgi:hypothetical protein
VRCSVTVKLVRRGKRVARKTLDGAPRRHPVFPPAAVKTARSALAARRRLKLTAVVTPADAAGNRRTTRFRMTVRAR